MVLSFGMQGLNFPQSNEDNEGINQSLNNPVIKNVSADAMFDTGGTNVWFQSGTVFKETASLVLVKLYEYTLNISPNPTLKIHFEIQNGIATNGRARIYVNGLPKGALRSGDGSYNEIIGEILNGDKIQLYAATINAADATRISYFQIRGGQVVVDTS